MEKIFAFIKYCIKCMLDGFGAMFGHVPEGYGLKEVFVGLGTLFVILFVIASILLLTGQIKIKK